MRFTHIVYSHNALDECKGVSKYISVMYSRKKVRAASIWKYEELPPADLLKSLHLGQAPISHSEFLRAAWFWNRRPKVLSESVVFFLCCLTVFVGLLYYFPEPIPLLVVWIVAGASCASVDRIRLNRWRNEYESSITRLIIHLYAP